MTPRHSPSTYAAAPAPFARHGRYILQNRPRTRRRWAAIQSPGRPARPATKPRPAVSSLAPPHQPGPSSERSERELPVLAAPPRKSRDDAQRPTRRPRVCRRAKARGSGAPALVRAPSQTAGALTCISSPSYTSSPRPSFATNLPLPSGTPCGVCGHGQRRCRGADTARTPHAALRPRSRTPRRPRPCVSHLEECADVRVLPGLEGTLAMHLP